MSTNLWHYAVVVGIDEYPDYQAGKKNLACARLDAEEMAKWLRSSRGGNLPKDNVTLITRLEPAGRSGAVPVITEINRAITQTVSGFHTRLNTAYVADIDRREVWKQSRFYFFISGHGIDSDGDDTAVLPADASEDSLLHISSASVLKHLKKASSFAEIIIMADACRDPNSTQITPLPIKLKGSRYVVENLPRTFVARACRTQRKAYEPPSDNAEGITLSLFTHALLEGLQGKIAAPQVTSTHLKDYVFNRVKELAAKYVLKQDGTPDEAGQAPEIQVEQEIIFLNSTEVTALPSAAPPLAVKLTAAAVSPWTSQPALEALIIINGEVISRHSLPASSPGVFEGQLRAGSYYAVPAGADPFQAAVTGMPFTLLGKDYHGTLS